MTVTSVRHPFGVKKGVKGRKMIKRMITGLFRDEDVSPFKYRATIWFVSLMI